MNQSYWVAEGLYNTETYYDDADGEIPYGSSYSGANKHNYRLKLNSVSIAGASGPEEKFYSFTYDPLRMPRRYNGSQDFFGYYNGKSTYIPAPYSADEEISIPAHFSFSPSPIYYGVDRTPDTSYMKAYVLTKIKNAFGGQVEFLYDKHVLSSVLNSTNTPGLPSDDYFFGTAAYDGLRLQAIIESDNFHPGNYLKTTFTYSGGQFFLNGGYFHYDWKLHDSNHSLKQIMMTNQYVSRHQFVNGANHGYSTVTVRSADENDDQLSRTVYTFSNFKDGSNDPKYQLVGAGSKYFFEFPYAEKQFLRDWEMGLPLSVIQYDQNNRITVETNNTYAFSIDSTTTSGEIENTKTGRVKTDFVPCCYDSLPHIVTTTDTYRPFRGKARLMSSQIKKYISDSDYIEDAITYKYDSHNNVIHILTNNSKGEFYKTENIYNYNLDILLGSGLQDFTDAGLEKLVSTQRWKTNDTGGTYVRLMDGFINTFDYSSQQVKPIAVYTFIPGDSVGRNMYTGYGGSGPIPNSHGKILDAFLGTTPDYFRKTSEVILSDAKGNPLESRLGDQDVFKAMIWDERTGQKLAEAGNCHYADIAYCGFETPATGVVTKGNVKYNASMVATPPYVGALGESAFSLTTSSGDIEGGQALTAQKYILSFWASGSTAPSVYSGSTTLTVPSPLQDFGDYHYYKIVFTATANDKFKISHPGGSTIFIDDVRLHPYTAQMQNWSYTPMFGTKVSNDANGRPTFIEYDGQGRAKIVRDKDGNIVSKTEYGLQ